MSFGLYDTFDGWRLHSGIVSAAADKKGSGVGQEIVVTLRVTADLPAAFAIVGVAAAVPMEEVDDGVYVGKTTVPAGVNGVFALSATLTNPENGQAARAAGGTIAIDTVRPEAPARVLAVVPWPGESGVSWTASPATDVDHHAVSRGEGKDPVVGGQPFAEVGTLDFVDTRVVLGLEYRYAVVAVDGWAMRGSPAMSYRRGRSRGKGLRLPASRWSPRAGLCGPGWW